MNSLAVKIDQRQHQIVFRAVSRIVWDGGWCDPESRDQRLILVIVDAIKLEEHAPDRRSDNSADGLSWWSRVTIALSAAKVWEKKAHIAAAESVQFRRCYRMRQRAHIFSFACAENQGGQRRLAITAKKGALGKAKDPSKSVDWLSSTTQEGWMFEDPQ